MYVGSSSVAKTRKEEKISIFRQPTQIKQNKTKQGELNQSFYRSERRMNNFFLIFMHFSKANQIFGGVDMCARAQYAAIYFCEIVSHHSSESSFFTVEVNDGRQADRRICTN
jgi:hypothetical protein